MRVIETFRTVVSLAFSPDGRRLAAAGWKHVAVWDLATGRELLFEQDGCEHCQAVTFAPDGAQIAWVAQEPVISGQPAYSSYRVARVAGGAETAVAFRTLAHRFAAPGNHGFLADGRLIALGDGAVLAAVRGVPSWAPPFPYLTPDTTRLAVSPDGRRVAAGRRDAVLLYVVAGGRVDGPRRVPKVRTLGGFASDRLVWFDTDREVCVYDAAAGEFRSRDVPVPVGLAAVTPDGRRGLGRVGTDAVGVFDLATGAEVRRFDWRVGRPDAVAVAPDGLTAAVAGPSGDLALFDLD